MSYPLPHNSAHENDSMLKTKKINSNEPNENCDQKQRASPLPSPLINTSLFSPKAFGPARGGPTKTPTLLLFQQLPCHPRKSEHIRPNPSNFPYRFPLHF